MNRRNHFRCLATFFFLFCSVLYAQETKTWPNKPITFVIGLAPGGATDVAARVVANALTKQLGQSVVVENRVGAGGYDCWGAGSTCRAGRLHVRD